MTCCPWDIFLKHVLMRKCKRVVEMHRQQILASGIILGTILVLSLVVIGAMQHRTSLQDSGVGLLWTDVALMVVYGFAGMLVWNQRSLRAMAAATVGAQIGLVIGAVAIANHL